MGALLDGIRVVELPGSVAASFCGKLLADVGADVVKIEPPGGDFLRRRAVGGDLEAEALFTTSNTSKSSWILEPTDAGHEALEGVIAAADVVLAGRSPEGVATADLDRWQHRFPSLVVTRIAPFGASGPRSSWASSNLIQYAMSCWLHITGRPEREPLAAGSDLAETVPGLSAAVATLMALWSREATGRGQTVDISQQESLMMCQPYLDVGFAYTGVVRQRNGMPFPMTIVPSSDGYLGVNVLTQTQWELLCAYTGRVDLLDDPRLAEPALRLGHTDELTQVFSEWAREQVAAAVFREGQEWRIPFGYVPPIAEVPSMEQHIEREFFVDVARPSGGDVAVPGVPFLVDGERHRPGPVPALGGGSFEGWARPASSDPATTRGGPVDEDASTDGGPLGGLRVVDLSMFWSGPLAAGLLAQYGADVVKVESVQRVDGWRGMAADTSIEKSNLFNSVNVNKSGITLDLTSEAGRELLRPLVEDADVLIENFSPRVMGSFGLTDDVLFEWNPQLTVLSMPAFGSTGPWRDFVGFAPTIEQLSGLPELTGYPDGPPELTGNSIADPCAGLAGCFALLSVLHRRRHERSDAGGTHIDLSQLEALTSLIGADVVEQQLSLAPSPRAGNGHDRFAPCGCYPCRDADTWIAITVADDAAWERLCDVAGAGWSTDTRFGDHELRRQHAAELDAVIGAWTSAHDHIELAERLQAAEVPAAPVLWPSELYRDEHVEHRGSSVALDREHVGTVRYPVLPFKFSRTPGRVRSAGPVLGQHNHEILMQRLGLTDAQLGELEEQRVIGTHLDSG